MLKFDSYFDDPVRIVCQQFRRSVCTLFLLQLFNYNKSFFFTCILHLATSNFYSNGSSWQTHIADLVLDNINYHSQSTRNQRENYQRLTYDSEETHRRVSRRNEDQRLKSTGVGVGGFFISKIGAIGLRKVCETVGDAFYRHIFEPSVWINYFVTLKTMLWASTT